MNLRVAFAVFFASYLASCNAEEHCDYVGDNCMHPDSECVCECGPETPTPECPSTTANILHCRDFSSQKSAWTSFFEARMYTNIFFVDRGNTTEPPPAIEQCRAALTSGTTWDAVIIEENGNTFGMTISPESEQWATSNPTKPLVLHDWTAPDGDFHDNFAISFESTSVNYDFFQPVNGGAFDGLSPLNVFNPGYGIFATSPSGGTNGTVEAIHSGGTAIARNGNVWGFGPLADTLQPINPDEAVFAYLEAILCCVDCAAFTPLEDIPQFGGVASDMPLNNIKTP